MARRSRIWALGLPVGLALGAIALIVAAHLWLEWTWFASLGLESTFALRLGTGIALFLAGGVVAGVVGWIASRTYRQAGSPSGPALAVAQAALFGLVFGVAAAGQTANLLAAIQQVP